MELKVQKKLAASVLKCSEARVVFDETRLAEIKEAITKADIRGLVANGAIIATPKKGVSRVRARKRQKKKRQGRYKGHGSRKGKKTARSVPKETWMIKIRK